MDERPTDQYSDIGGLDKQIQDPLHLASGSLGSWGLLSLLKYTVEMSEIVHWNYARPLIVVKFFDFS